MSKEWRNTIFCKTENRLAKSACYSLLKIGKLNKDILKRCGCIFAFEIS